ncbi:MAG: BON domain-containing protein [Gammaproteobacteria bacterium]|nr:BON domain-containing protein [Gammaproteobacteria bacterium]
MFAAAALLGTVLLASGCAAALVGRAAGPGGGSATSSAPAAQRASDQALAEAVRARLAREPATRAIPVLVECREGVVTLRGLVESQQQRAAIEGAARGVRGIAAVRNELRLR